MSPNENAFDYARKLAQEGFWGFLTLKYEKGLIVHVRREENLKPNELAVMQQLPEKNRGNDRESSIRR